MVVQLQNALLKNNNNHHLNEKVALEIERPFLFYVKRTLKIC
jgi:hypothetical protein